METFLNYIAQDLVARFGNKLQKMVIIFPNKRASLFMNEYLAQASDQPVWAPTYITISELFRKFSNIEVPDKIRLVCELYPIYCKLRHLTEQDMPLDRFYSWGELLLSDFDDVDKNMVPAEKLFQNLKELKDLNDLDFLSDEQRNALGLFFDSFQFNDTQIQQEFIHVWDILGTLYIQFKEHLLTENLLYEGALFRHVVNNLQPKHLTADKYIFVGFNLLDKVEETLFEKIKETGKALFYWDYDLYYLNGKEGEMEAGLFLKRNLLSFKNELPESYFQSMKKPKEVEIIAAATENAQVNYISPWLKQNITKKESKTAVVLCNETLLEPVLHALPDDIENLNITMGFPLSSTPIYSFVKALCELHISGYNKEKGCYRFAEVRAVLLHPYAQMMSEHAAEKLNDLTNKNKFYPSPLDFHEDDLLSLLFPATCLEDDPAEFLIYLRKQVEIAAHSLSNLKENINATFTPLYHEAMFTAYTLLNRLIKEVEDKILTVNSKTLIRFIDQLMNRASIPFHGEPITGLQVMGVLETRCLDFKHIIMLSLNEGLLPKSGNNASFIPYNLRRAFQMTLVEHKMAVYAYYFYRLLQRTEKITFVYNNNTEGLQKGEMSRFLLQYLIEHPENHHITLRTLTTEQEPVLAQQISIPKTPEMLNNLISRYQKENKRPDGKTNRKYLSPSALNTYINCPLEFYFHYIAGINVPEEITDDIDNATFGNIFHKCSEAIYLKLTHGTGTGDITESMLQDILKNDYFLHETVNHFLKTEVFKMENPEEEMPTLNGIQYIIQHVMLRYVKQLLQRDLSLVPFTIRGLEKPIYDKVHFQVNGQETWVNVGGNIDRMDEYTDKETGKRILRIIDYKTSGSPQKASTLDDLFLNGISGRQYHALQTFFYAMQVNHNGLNPHNYPICPSLFYIQKAAGNDYRPAVEIKKEDGIISSITDFETEIGDNYRLKIKEKLEELFNVETPFTQCDGSHCQYCDYASICRR